jgi:predicted XRE-type DNA-binding protein
MAKRKTESVSHKAKSATTKPEPGVGGMRIERSSGNIFADLELPDAVELDTKLRLAWAINHEIEDRGLPQMAVAALLGVNQPKVSALKNYKLDGFSVERLMTFLTALGSDIEIRIRKPKRGTAGAGRILVEAA